MGFSSMKPALLRGLLVAVFAVVTTSVSAGDLVTHNGFASCWRSAITKASFLGLIQSSIEGTQGCVSPQSGTSPFPYTVCNTAACPGGVTGCPVTLHAGAASGDFTTGAFTAPGSANTVSVPINYLTTQNCTMTLSAIVLNYALQYTLSADGNSGAYTGALATPTVTITSYTVGGNCPSTFASLAAAAATQTQTAAANAIYPLLTAGTVDESVCPLTP